MKKANQTKRRTRAGRFHKLHRSLEPPTSDFSGRICGNDQQPQGCAFASLGGCICPSVLAIGSAFLTAFRGPKRMLLRIPLLTTAAACLATWGTHALAGSMKTNVPVEVLQPESRNWSHTRTTIKQAIRWGLWASPQEANRAYALLQAKEEAQQRLTGRPQALKLTLTQLKQAYQRDCSTHKYQLFDRPTTINFASIASIWTLVRDSL